MGSHLARSYITERDTAPDPKVPFNNDPQFGFSQDRRERGNKLIILDLLLFIIIIYGYYYIISLHSSVYILIIQSGETREN